jgi:4-hydroxybenzoyl-CoA reductase subunit alpha
MGGKKMQEYSIVGKPVPRIDGIAKVTGEAKFTGDLMLPRMLYAKILRSPYPHARILNIDTTRAKRISGVKAIITGNEVAGLQLHRIFSPIKDEPILTADKVRYIGEEVAAVAAVDEDTAQEALELIKVEYEPLPAIFNPEEAMLQDAPQIHVHTKNNIAHQISMNFGDLELEFKNSDYIHEDRYTTAYYTNWSIEADSCLAQFDSSNKLTLWTPTQSPYILRKEIAGTMGLEESQIRIIAPHIGGSFGSRLGGEAHHYVAALLARATGRPVMLKLTQEEILNRGNSMIVQLKTGVKRDGTLLARELKVIADAGGYLGLGGLDLHISGVRNLLPYKLSAFQFQGFAVYTNNPVRGFLSGEGIRVTNLAASIQLDIIAENLGIDPVDICLKNAIQPNYIMANKTRISSCGLTECIHKVIKNTRWDGKRRTLQQEQRGIGIGCGSASSGAKGILSHGISAAIAKVQEDGSVVILTGLPDIGQGSSTMLAQIAAEELGLPLEKIIVYSADAEISPIDIGALGQRGVYITGSAVKAAIGEIRRQLLEVAADCLQTEIDALAIQGGRIVLKEDSEKGISIAEVIQASQSSERGQPLMGKGFCNLNNQPPDITTFSFGAQLAEVAIDRETAKIKLKKMTAAHDVGFAINPMAVEGQIQGQIWSGMDMTLFQERFLEQGQNLNTSFLDYKFSTAMDTPEIETMIVETDDPYGPFGAKEVGRGPIMAVAQAIANAVYDITGVRVKSFPITPEKILMARERKK